MRTGKCPVRFPACLSRVLCLNDTRKAAGTESGLGDCVRPGQIRQAQVMNISELIQKITSGETPTGIIGGGGILALIMAVMVRKGLKKILLVLLALALIGGAVWWHFHLR